MLYVLRCDVIYYVVLFVPQVGDEKKRKSEVKHIQLRKRKALADLFRQLIAMGESNASSQASSSVTTTI